MKITDLSLFHNHEPVIEIFGYFHSKVINRLREVVFEEFAATQRYGLIFTNMWTFDMQSDLDYIEHVKDIFKQKNKNTEFYYVELIASQTIQLERNVTENRLKNKASKRDLAASRQRLLNDDANHRCESFEGEIPFDNYLKIDNSHLQPAMVMVCMLISLTCVAAGFIRRSGSLRLYGLILTKVCVLKLATRDVAGLETLLRILTLIGGGVICFAVSAIYSYPVRRLPGRNPADGNKDLTE